MTKYHRCKKNNRPRMTEISIEFFEVKAKNGTIRSWQLCILDARMGWRNCYKIIACPFCAKKLEIPKEEKPIPL